MKMNPFQAAKARLLKQKESQETENSSLKEKREEAVELEEETTITLK